MKTRNLSMWCGQVLLALFFAYAGSTKLSQTPEALAAMGWHWAEDVPPLLITFVGLAEILGAIGIILPAALRILPSLSTLAAAGMALLQLAAIVLHVSRTEFSMLWLNAIMLLLAGSIVAARLTGGVRAAPAHVASTQTLRR